MQYREEKPVTCHFIRETVLEQLVLEELRDLLAFVTRYEKRFIRLVTDKSRQERNERRVEHEAYSRETPPPHCRD